MANVIVVESSLCDARFGACDLHAHMHCSVATCRALLMALGEGPVYAGDGPIIDGYADANGNRALLCSGCGDEFFLLCKACADIDPHCGVCRAEATA